MYNKNCIL